MAPDIGPQDLEPGCACCTHTLNGKPFTKTRAAPAWPFKDRDSTHPLFDLLVGYIHAFRMPVFFAVAGFFGALLFHEKSPRDMLKNRLARGLFYLVHLPLVLSRPAGRHRPTRLSQILSGPRGDGPVLLGQLRLPGPRYRGRSLSQRQEIPAGDAWGRKRHTGFGPG